MRRLLLAAAILAALMVTAASARAASLGFNVEPILFDSYHGSISQSDADRVLSDLHAAGIRRVRADAPGDWAFEDYTAQKLAAHGLRWDAILDAPATSQVWFTWRLPRLSSTATFVQRYRPILSQIEVGNEPDYAFQHWGFPSPLQYARAYGVEWRAVKSVAPRLPVIPGGMCCSTHYVRRFLHDLAHRRRWLENGFAMHAYYWLPPTIGHILNSYGLGAVRLVVNEFGWTTDAGWMSVPSEQTREFDYHWAICRFRANRRVRLVEPYAWGVAIVNAFESLMPVLRQPC